MSHTPRWNYSVLSCLTGSGTDGLSIPLLSLEPECWQDLKPLDFGAFYILDLMVNWVISMHISPNLKPFWDKALLVRYSACAQSRKQCWTSLQGTSKVAQSCFIILKIKTAFRASTVITAIRYNHMLITSRYEEHSTRRTAMNTQLWYYTEYWLLRSHL